MQRAKQLCRVGCILSRNKNHENVELFETTPTYNQPTINTVYNNFI